MKCLKCGQDYIEGNSYCIYCGTPRPKQGKELTAWLNSKKKLIAVISGAALCLAAVAVGLFAWQPWAQTRQQSYALYMEGEAFVASSLKGGEKIELWPRGEEVYSAIELGSYTQQDIMFKYSEDGRYLFFPVKEEQNSEGYSIYRRELSLADTDSKALVKLSAEADGIYNVSEDGQYVYYRKDNEIYKQGVGGYKKLAEDTGDGDAFMVFPKENLMIYTKGGIFNGQIYEMNLSTEESVLLTEGGASGLRVSEGGSLYYEKDGNLCEKPLNKEPKILVEDILSYSQVSKDGAFYFTREKPEQEPIKLANIIDDDFLEKDKGLKPPEYSIKTPDEEYDAAANEYYGKQLRDKLRKELATASYEEDGAVLYYYDGKTEKQVCQDPGMDLSGLSAETTVFFAAKENTGEKIKMSQLTEFSCVELVEKWKNEGSKTKLQYVYNGQLFPLKADKIYSPVLSRDGKTLYYMDSMDTEGKLISLDLSKGDTAEPQVLGQSVSQFAVNENNCIYFTDVKDSLGSLFINGEKVDDGVRVSFETTGSLNNNELYYLLGGKENSPGELMLFKDGKTSALASGVSPQLSITDGEGLLFTHSLNSEGYGILSYYEKGKAQALGENIPINSENEKGSSGLWLSITAGKQAENKYLQGYKGTVFPEKNRNIGIDEELLSYQAQPEITKPPLASELNPLKWVIEPERDFDDVALVDYSEYPTMQLWGSVDGQFISQHPTGYAGQYFYDSAERGWGVLAADGSVLLDGSLDIYWSPHGYATNFPEYRCFDNQGVEFKPLPRGGNDRIGYNTAEQQIYLLDMNFSPITPNYPMLLKPFTAVESPLGADIQEEDYFIFVNPDGTVPNGEQYMDIRCAPEYLGRGFGNNKIHEGTVTELACVQSSDGMWKFIDTSGQDAGLGSYSDMLPFHEGLAAVKKDGKWGYIDTDGKEKIPFVLEDASSVSIGQAWAKYEGKWGKLSIE